MNPLRAGTHEYSRAGNSECGLKWRAPLQQPTLREAHGRRGTHYDVVQGADFHKCQRVFQAPGEVLVGAAGFGDSAWVVMREDDGGGVVL